LLTIFEHISWKFSLGAGAPFYVGLQKKEFSLPLRGTLLAENFMGCDAFCANSTVKNFPFFARFS
jgi:hypothetical protein